jgi:hypothetical protein
VPTTSNSWTFQRTSSRYTRSTPLRDILFLSPSDRGMSCVMCFKTVHRRMQEGMSVGPESSDGAERSSSPKDLTGQLRRDQVNSTETTSIRYISGTLLKDIIKSNDEETYTIIDCRFTHEYAGGHIRGAKNYWTEESINTLLFSNPPSNNKTLLILHCEYSERRAPRMYVLM